MKKVLAILLLFIYLFNLAGYSLVFAYFSHRADLAIAQHADNNTYRDDELIQISIPLSLPYMPESNEFKRVDGSIENNGKYYNYVKCRWSNDTLHILCLPNQQKTQLAKNKARYSGTVNDFGTDKKQKDASAKKAELTDQDNQRHTAYKLCFPGVALASSFADKNSALLSACRNVPEQPPRHSC